MPTKFKKGDRVILIDPLNKYTPSDSNPHYRIYKIKGTVTDTRGYLLVSWDNKHGNYYRGEDLELSEKEFVGHRRTKIFL